MSKQLYKIPAEGMIGGVCAGLADYFDIDVSIIRVVFVILALLHGVGVIAYIILLVILPEKSASAAKEPEQPQKSSNSSALSHWRKHSEMIGMALVFIGILLVIANFLALAIWLLWPIFFILIGLMILFNPQIKE
ncbi:MAG: PspC domain-containing protein [Patescibacteria group bacterium]|jgi:phage shock protein PspC (stress-responsive transcriptional regulator)